MLNNKVPTWNNMKKKKKEGPKWCTLCKADEESVSHLFIFCPFAVQVWKPCSDLLSQACYWQGQRVEDAWQSSLVSGANMMIKALSLILSWGVWLARNASIF
jgi:hypothetical protein